MLTGMLPASEGDALIFGNSIKNEMDDIRRQVGMCPQHSVLYASLTVKEHMELFAAIKGVPASEVSFAVATMIEDVGLSDKTHAFSDSLSGGMKRKLSLGLALLVCSPIFRILTF